MTQKNFGFGPSGAATGLDGIKYTLPRLYCAERRIAWSAAKAAPPTSMTVAPAESSLSRRATCLRSRFFCGRRVRAAAAVASRASRRAGAGLLMVFSAGAAPLGPRPRAGGSSRQLPSYRIAGRCAQLDAIDGFRPRPRRTISLSKARRYTAGTLCGLRDERA